MSKRLVLFGEGDGDVTALPVLVRRLLTERGGWDTLHLDPNCLKVGDVHRLSKNWQRMVKYALKRRDVGAMLVVLDGDADFFPAGSQQTFCAAAVAAELAQRAKAEVGAGERFSLALVFACCEYESWLIAGAESLAGKRLSDDRLALPPETQAPEGDLEVTPRGAKEWLGKRMGSGYKERLDQAEFTQAVDLSIIRNRRMRSFQRLENAISQLVEANRTGQHVCTPE